MNSIAPLSHRAGRRIALLIGASLLILHAWRYLPLFDDDAFISLRYAQRLLDEHGLTWTDGPRVEGYSNLLWILMVAAVGSLGVDLVTSARVLGLILMIATMAAILRSTSPEKGHPVPLFLGLLVFPIAIPIAVWSIAGLEQPLVACLLAWSVVITRDEPGHGTPLHRTVMASGLLGLLCLVRPDLPLAAMAIILGASISDGFHRAAFRRAITLATGPCIAVVGQMVFRLAYYGQWLPSPALVKIAPSVRRVETGWDYVTGGLFAMRPVAILAVIAATYCLIRPDLRRRQYPLVFVFVLWCGYLTLIGGDIFAAWRHFVPLIVIFALVISEAVLDAWQRFNLPRFRVGLAALVLATLVGAAWTQSHDERNTRALSQHTEWDGRTVGLMLRRAFGDAAPLIAVDAAGSVPYWSGLPALDMLGLNDAHIRHRPPPDFGKGFIGHELGDGRYVLDRRPDLILFRGPAGTRNAVYRSGLQMQALPEFREEYSPVTFETRPPESFRSVMWVRRASSKIGIRTLPDSIAVPAYLLNGNPQTVAQESEDGAFTILVSPDCPALVESLTLPPGRWKLSTEPAGTMKAIVTLGRDTPTEGTLPMELTIPQDESPALRIELRSATPQKIGCLLAIRDSE